MLAEVKEGEDGLLNANVFDTFSESQPMFEIEEVSEVLDNVFGILFFTSFQVSPYQNIVVQFLR